MGVYHNQIENRLEEHTNFATAGGTLSFMSNGKSYTFEHIGFSQYKSGAASNMWQIFSDRSGDTCYINTQNPETIFSGFWCQATNGQTAYFEYNHDGG